MSLPLIQIESLMLRIEGRSLIEDLSFEVSSGHRLGITGPSGCGKSTLIRAIITGKWPSSTAYSSFAVDSRVRSARIGYVPQGNALCPWFTVRRLLTELHPLGQRNGRAGKEVHEILEVLELGDVVCSFPDMLSGGEYQRVLVAAAIAVKPLLYLADEPLTEVGLEQRWLLLSRWSDFIEQSSASMVLVSHDLDTLCFMCDEVIVLSGTPAQELVRVHVPGRHPRRLDEVFTGAPSVARIQLLDALVGVSPFGERP